MGSEAKISVGSHTFHKRDVMYAHSKACARFMVASNEHNCISLLVGVKTKTQHSVVFAVCIF